MGAGNRERRRLTGLDKVHDIASQLVALGLLVFLCWGAWELVWPSSRAGAREVLAIINDNWKAAMFFLVVVFFRPIRSFLDRLKRAWGLEAQEEVAEQLPPAEPPPQSPPPSGAPGGGGS